eukprot:gene140-2356_t
MSEFWQANPSVELVVPRDVSNNGFIGEYLSLLAPGARVYEYDTATTEPTGERLRIKHRTTFADWPPVVLDAPAFWEAPVSLHTVSPPSALRSLRKRLNDVLGLPARLSQQPPLVWASRGSGNLRKFTKESEFLEHLKAALPDWSVKVFNGDASAVADAAVMFAAADAVVGVHGGALVNLIFCQPGTQVFELGFPKVPQAWDYLYLSMALGLHHSLIPVDSDGSGMGAAQ